MSVKRTALVDLENGIKKRSRTFQEGVPESEKAQAELISVPIKKEDAKESWPPVRSRMKRESYETPVSVLKARSDVWALPLHLKSDKDRKMCLAGDEDKKITELSTHVIHLQKEQDKLARINIRLEMENTQLK
ncbi:hypothetical protein E1B28_008505 [Marasmius oreades]|uniref:Uncharacterized protein n=1 Tax=Marasmius oreades TaxID=181124 RepID=A0A9P7UTD0_9AGAR|nr:uncharacterized protein E1B28_008505 [Marasmius oreades]KAG7092131.1 hypothetical protein E1B28_008505 [Marasmius oreades]